MADARPHSPSSAVSWAPREIVEAFLDEVCARHLARSRCGGASRLTLEMQATAIPRPARPVRCSASRSKQRALSRCSGPQAQSIEGMPSLMGNFLPVSGQTSCPSTISTSSSTWCSARRNGSSSRNSAGTSAGSGGSRARLAAVLTSAGYSSFSTIRATNSALNSDSTVSIFSTSMASGNPFLVFGDISMLCVSSFMAVRLREERRLQPVIPSKHLFPAQYVAPPKRRLP
mmetsp:Transcript_26750/g.51937  ORF Transcript_26750/g.51937 Transcript_26750/m.51937 type:complete len:230 (+) Transcript_26750:294-983(+)